MRTGVSIKEAANRLGVSEQWIRRLCREGTLEAWKFGASWMVSAKSLEFYESDKTLRVAEDHPSYSPAKFSKPIALSFFSGAMGLDLGLERAGFDIRLACEVDKYCRQTISANRPHMALVGDINDYTAEQILSFARLEKNVDVDLIVGGPPCQAFSTAGKRSGFNDTRGNAFLTFLKTALQIRPKFLVIENVRGLLSCPMSHRPHEMRGKGYPELTLDELPGGALNFVLSEIRKSGYGYSFNLYNAANFGTPQVRERVVIVCARDGKRPPFLVPTHSENNADGLLPWKTFRQATRGIKKHDHINFPEKRLFFYRMLKAGQNWRSLPEKMQKQALGNAFYAGGGKTGFLRRLSWDKPAPTLVTHPAMPATDLAHPQQDRPLSIQEYKRLQEFPDDWKIAGPLLEQYKQVGNAVPGSLGFAIGLLIVKLLASEKVEIRADFNYSRYRKTCDYSWRENFENLAEFSRVKQARLF